MSTYDFSSMEGKRIGGMRRMAYGVILIYLLEKKTWERKKRLERKLPQFQGAPLSTLLNQMTKAKILDRKPHENQVKEVMFQFNLENYKKFLKEEGKLNKTEIDLLLSQKTDIFSTKGNHHIGITKVENNLQRIEMNSPRNLLFFPILYRMMFIPEKEQKEILLKVVKALDMI